MAKAALLVPTFTHDRKLQTAHFNKGIRVGSPVGLETRTSTQSPMRTMEKPVPLSPETLKQRHQLENEMHSCAGAGCVQALRISIGSG